MPKIQTYINNNVFEQINDLVMQRKQEGVEEATFSSVSSMLLELGLRVYELQRQKKEGGFNQAEYNRVMLDSLSRVRAMCTEIMRMGTLNQEVISSGQFELKVLERAVNKYADEQVTIFFPEDEPDNND